MAKVYTHPERLVRILSKLSLQDLNDLHSNAAYTVDVRKFLSGGGDVGYTPVWYAAGDMARVRKRALRSAAKWNIGWRGVPFRIGDRVRVVAQPSITGTVVRHDCGSRLVILDDAADTWAEEGEEGVLTYRPDELEPYPMHKEA